MESLPGSGKIVDGAKTFDPGHIFDYFAGEFFDRLDEDMLAFLLKSAFLPYMTPENARSLTGIRISSKLLMLLHRNNLFTEKLSTPRPLYRYHALFREFLLARARERFSKKKQAELRCRAAILLEKAGQLDEALELYADAGDRDSMTRLILRQAPAAAKQGRTRTLEGWIRRLPEKSPDAEPWLSYWLGSCRMSTDLDEALALFEKAFDRFDENENTEGALTAWAGAVDALLYRYGDMSPLDRWIEWLDEHMEKDGAFPSKHLEARIAGCMAGALMYRRMQRSDVEAWFNRAWRAARETGDPECLLHAGFSLIYYYLWTGHPARGKLILDTLRSAVRPEESSPLVLLMFKVTESQLTIQLGHYDEASRAIGEGLDIGRRSGVHLKDSLLCSQGVYLALTLGDAEKARSYFEKMHQSALPVRGRVELALYDHLKTWLHLVEGDAGAAVECAENAFELGTGCGSPFLMAFGNHGLALALFERGDVEKARQHVNESIRLARECRSPAHEYHSLLTAAYFDLRSGRKDAGVELLGQALELGRSYDYVHYPIWWLPDMLELLCTAALERGIEPAYVKALIRARGFTPREPPVEMETWPWPVKIHTLGRFKVLVDDRPLQSSRKVRKKPLELMKALVALGGDAVEEEKLSGALWARSAGESAHRSFSTTLHRLRRLLGDEKLLELQGGRLSLDRRRVWVDAAAFEKAFENAEEARRGGRIRQAREWYARAVDLYGGHFLADEPDAAWASSMRERLRNTFVQAVARAGDMLEEAGKHEEALDQYEKALEIDVRSDELYRRALGCCRTLGLDADAARIEKRRGKEAETPPPAEI